MLKTLPLFYLNLFREEVLSLHSHKMAKKNQSRYLLDNRLIPAPKVAMDPDSSATDGNQRLRQRRIHLCRTNKRQWVAGSAGSITFACASVTDYPRTQWRCFLLDSGRQFQKIATIRKYIDMASLLK